MTPRKENIRFTRNSFDRACSSVLLLVMLFIASGILTSFEDLVAEDTVELLEKSESEKDSSEEKSEQKAETDDFTHFTLDIKSLVARQELEAMHSVLEHHTVHIDIFCPPPEHA